MKKVFLAVVLIGIFVGIAQAGTGVALVSTGEYLRRGVWNPALVDTMVADSVSGSCIIDSNTIFTSYQYPWGSIGGYGSLWFKISSVLGVVNIDIVKDYSPDGAHWLTPPDSLILAAYSTEAQNGKFIFFNSSISGETSTTIPCVSFVRFRFKNIPNGRSDTRLMSRIRFGQ